jgi:hypothetical protein
MIDNRLIAYLGWSLTIAANPLIPIYLRLWLSLLMNLLIEVAAVSRSIMLGYIVVTVLTTSYTIYNVIVIKNIQYKWVLWLFLWNKNKLFVFPQW